jgi:uncharacterized protein (DUF1697 family)
MARWAVLLRGINVGGKNRLPMADLREMCETLWPQSAPRTLIASGNVVLTAKGTAAGLATQLGETVAASFGLKVAVLFVAETSFRATVAGCPFVHEAEGKGVHGFFCFTPPTIVAEKRDQWMIAGEGLVQDGLVVWLHTPQGISKSKLADNLGHVIGHVPTTARNLNTLRKLVEMLDV